MVEISDIKDRDSLKAWLEELQFDEDENRRIALKISYRVAMRVLPVFWRWVLANQEDPKFDLEVLPLLRSCLLSGVAGDLPKPEIKIAPDAIRSCAHSAYANQTTQDGNVTSAAYSIYSALALADVRERRAPNLLKIPNGVTQKDSASSRRAYVVGSEFAGAGANAVSGVYPEIWNEIRKDCETLVAGGRGIDTSPLWNFGNSASEEWRFLRENLPAGWEFWRDWYQDALDGEQPNWNLLAKIALIKPVDWDTDSDHVNGLIAEIQLKYAVAASPNAEDLIVNDDGLFEIILRSDLPAGTLQDVQDRLRDVIADIRRAQQQENNQYNPLVAEADLLERILARYPDNALRLHEACTKVIIHIGGNVANGVLPENDNLVGDVSGDVQVCADDIYNFDAEVKTAIDARNKLRFARLSDEQKAAIVQFTEAVAQNSVEPLAEELREDVQVVKDELVPSEETASERYRLGSRLARALVLGAKNVGGALILLGSVAGGVTALVWVVRILLGAIL